MTRIELLTEINDILETWHEDLLTSEQFQKILFVGLRSLSFIIRRIIRLNELYAPYDHLQSDMLWAELFDCFPLMREYLETEEEMRGEKEVQTKLKKLNGLFDQLGKDTLVQQMLKRSTGRGNCTMVLKMIQRK
jgi:hypothetical protein